MRWRFWMLGLVVALSLACGSNHAPLQRILIVTIDTLRWDHLGFTGYDVETPNLDHLAASGTAFTHVVTAAPLTLPSHTSLFTGLYPPSHGVRANGVFRVADDVETLAEVFRDEGFATGAFVGSFVLESRFGLDQGFDVYDDDLPDENSVNKIYFRERRAKEVVARATAWIRKRSDAPFFAWVHVFDPHAPYDPPSPFRESYAGRPYAGEIAYTDDALGPLLTLVHSMDRSLVVVTADHGESLGEHGESTHGLFIYEATTRVPLVMSGSGVPSGKRVEARVRTVDVLPTVLSLAGLEIPAAIDGESLLPFLGAGASPSRDAYTESFLPRYSFNWSELRALQKGRYKFIRAPRPELYDLEADPEEAGNLWGDGAANEGKPLARALARRIEQEGAIGKTVAIDDETAKRLESLGYLMSDASSAEEDRPRPDPKDRIGTYERMQALLSPDLTPEQLLEGYHEILDAEPTNNLARNRLANTLSEEGRLEEAVEQYRILVRNSEIDFKGWENLSAALLLQKRTKEALETTKKAVAAAPWNPDFLVLRGEALEQDGRPGEALAAYGAAVERDPSAENYWRRGVVREKLGASEQGEADAEKDFRRALERDASFEPARVALARLLSRTGRLERAYALLDATEGAGDSAELEAARAEVHIASGRFGEAKALLEKARKQAPDNTRVLALLGPLYARDGDMARASATLERAVSLGETSPEVRRNLGVVYLRLGKARAAVATLEAASRDAPDAPDVWYALGNARAEAGNMRHAVPAYERALELRSPWPQAAFNLGVAAESAGARDKAAAAFRRYLGSAGTGDARRREEAQKRLRRLEGSR